ncbi:hypothetical protein FBY21_2616 [Pseudomonas sp. SLBN-26]|jgi:hypothetical protein|uniref:hypothetical protein n=1 Tax=Pseudomonadaceae TaxID=135621 RepID=UPI00114FD4FB|nr:MULTISPECIES: hypothetical protein [Pseudomonas]MCP1617998.1 hypothetical protein [Pseudomonas otitidis]TQL07237.1 hypothetical protein FBY21_2616 [Pseudomonas sp. SLBN-26]
MKRLFALGLALCLSLPLAHARTLSVIGDREVFGLPADASPERFVEALGEPTVRLPMSGNSQGLLYGNSLLLVFQDGRLAEVRCWRLDRFTDELGLGWLQRVAPGAATWDFVVDKQLALGMDRERALTLMQGLEGDGDEYSDVRQRGGSTLWLGYGQSGNYGLEGPDRQVVTSLTVTYDAPGDE